VRRGRGRRRLRLPRRYAWNEHDCADIDECKAGPAGCAQVCVNTSGSFECRCEAGYTLDADGRACDARTWDAPVEVTRGQSWLIADGRGGRLQVVTLRDCDVFWRLYTDGAWESEFKLEGDTFCPKSLRAAMNHKGDSVVFWDRTTQDSRLLEAHQPEAIRYNALVPPSAAPSARPVAALVEKPATLTILGAGMNEAGLALVAYATAYKGGGSSLVTSLEATAAWQGTQSVTDVPSTFLPVMVDEADRLIWGISTYSYAKPSTLYFGRISSGLAREDPTVIVSNNVPISAQKSLSPGGRHGYIAFSYTSTSDRTLHISGRKYTTGVIASADETLPSFVSVGSVSLALNDTGEAVLATSRDGYIAVSRRVGLSFQPLEEVEPTAAGNDAGPQALLDNDGNLYLAWLRGTAQQAEVWATYRMADGAFVPPVRVSGSYAGPLGELKLVWDEGQSVAALWQESAGGAGAVVRMSRLR
jgi:hypothetical protein